MRFPEVQTISPTTLALCIIGAFLCLLGYATRFGLHFYQYKKATDLPRRMYRLSLVAVFLGCLGWGFWCGNDPVKMRISSSLSVPLGIILFHIGLPLVFRSFAALVSTVLWAAIIFAWKVYEERNLVRRFGEKYIEYKQNTWF